MIIFRGNKMSLSEKIVEEYAKALIKAEDTQTPIEPITKQHPELNLEDAYKIQLKIIEEKTKRGEIIIGKKIGLTSKAMQELAGINEPDYGFLTDRMIIYEDFPIKRSELINPRVEAEIAFVLKKELKGPGVTVSDVIQATDYVMPCLEIIDGRTTRIPGERRVENSILDNAAVGKVVFGAKRCPIDDIDLRIIGLVFERNGEIVSTAAGAAVYGNPIQAVAWLANKLSQFGVTLKAGETIISGSLIAAVQAGAGDCFTATFDRLGPVKVKFIT
jgi:2-oxopent-4-enoate hydratase